MIVQSIDLGTQGTIRDVGRALGSVAGGIHTELKAIRKAVEMIERYQKSQAEIIEATDRAAKREIFLEIKRLEKVKRSGKKPKDSPEKIQEKILAELQKLNKSQKKK